MKKFTKKDEQFAINNALKGAQKEFIARYGFAPALKDMHPLECSFEYFQPEFCTDGIWFCPNIAFHVGGFGYTFDGFTVQKADWYNMSWVGGER